MNTEKAIQLKKDYESKIQGLESEISNKSTQVQDLKRRLEDIKIEKVANEELKMLALEVIDCCYFWSLSFDSLDPYKTKVQDVEGFPPYILDYGKEEKSIVKDVKFSLPKERFIGAQLNANCVDIELGNSKKFGGFVKLSSLGVEPIILPIDKTSQFFKWKNRGSRLCKAIKLFKKGFQLSWDYERIPKPQGSKVVGFDQGYKTVATLSDGQTTPTVDNHGHSLESVILKLARRKKGSKSFRRAQAHRKNFVHWSINQLDLRSLKELRLEKVVNIGFRKKRSRKLSHWSNPEIRDKIKRRCEELEVPVVEQSCCYRSQRCSNCGLVRKANRKGKIYKCKSCSFESDSDLNAAKNHEVDLDPIPYVFRGSKLNLGNGFLWKPEGLFKIDGSELVVPSSHEKIFQ